MLFIYKQLPIKDWKPCKGDVLHPKVFRSNTYVFEEFILLYIFLFIVIYLNINNLICKYFILYNIY